MYGIDSFSAVINPPQAAILAVGSVRRRPVVDDAGEIVARDTVQLTLACDHRILYGVDGARFMARLRELLESPLSLLL
jgi:pyruvate dehydrogenase E2 component (dihydrolipoamide acetyltransferase)